MRRVIGSLSLVLLTTFALSSLATPVRADALGYVDLDFTGSSNVGVQVTDTNVSNNAESTSAGPYYYTLYNPSGTPASSFPASSLGAGNSKTKSGGISYAGFCIGLHTNISVGGGAGPVGGPSNGIYADFKVQKLSDAITDTTVLSHVEQLLYQYDNSHLAGASLASPGVGIASDALTVDIWEVMNETHNITPFDVTTGNVTDAGLPAGAVTQANAWLHLLDTGTLATDAAHYFDPITGKVQAYGLTDGSVQPQSIYIGGGFGAQTPEPSPLVSLGGMGLLGLTIGGSTIAFRRRRATRERISASAS